MEENESTCCKSSGLTCFLSGALVGAGIALLYAPKTGRELREKVSGMTGDTIGKMKDFSAEAQEKMRSTFNKGKQMAEEKGAALSSAAEEAKQAFH